MDTCARVARFDNMTNFPLIMTNFPLLYDSFPPLKKQGRFSSSCVIAAYYTHVSKNIVDR